MPATIKMFTQAPEKGLMTKYSIFEHAQPYETPLGSIDEQDLLKDIETMRAWIAEFDGRKISEKSPNLNGP